MILHYLISAAWKCNNFTIYVYYRKLYITCENKDVIRELLEDILQVDADIEMPDIPENSSTMKRNSINDKDGDQDPDNGSSSGSPPPSKQPKQEPEDGGGNHGSSDNAENGDENPANGFGSEDPGEFRQNCIKISPIDSKSKKMATKSKFSSFHLPISPPHDVVFDDEEDDFDDIPLPLLEPETQLEDGPETSDELLRVLDDNEEIDNEVGSSKNSVKLKLSSIKANLKSNPISTKFASMKFGLFNKNGEQSSNVTPLDDAHIKTEFDNEENFPQIGTLQENQPKLSKGKQRKSTKGGKQSGTKNKGSLSTGGLLTGNGTNPLSMAEFEVKQEFLNMQDPDSLPIEEREIKQETLEEEMRQAFDYYGKNAQSAMQHGMNLPLPSNLPLPPNLPLPLNFPQFGGLGMFGFNQALFNGHQNSFLPPPVPMPPSPGMVIKAGKWVDPTQARKTAKEGKAPSKKIHKHHFMPHTITGKVLERTLQTLTEPEGEHKCDFCGNIYNKKASLESHIKRNHNPNLTVKCPECPKLLSCHAAIKKHLLTHRPESEWPYICEFCGKRFQAKGDLPKHFVTAQHRDDPRVPKPGSPEWQIVLDRSAVAGSSFVPKEGRGRKRKDPKDKNGDLPSDLIQESSSNSVKLKNTSSKMDFHMNNMLPFPPLPNPDDLPFIKEEPDNDNEISNLLYPEITMNSSQNNLAINKTSKTKKSSTKNNTKAKKLSGNNMDPFLGVPMQNNMEQNPFLMAYLMNQYMGMNGQVLKDQANDKKKAGKKTAERDSTKDNSTSARDTSSTCLEANKSPCKESIKQNHTEPNNSNILHQAKEDKREEVIENGQIKVEEPNESMSEDNTLKTTPQLDASIDSKVIIRNSELPEPSALMYKYPENNSIVPENNVKDNNDEVCKKPLPSFKTMQNNTQQDQQQPEINDDHPPPTPGFNIMDILEEEPILPNDNGPNVPECSLVNSNNEASMTRGDAQINQNINDPQINGPQMNRECSQIMPQAGLSRHPQNIHGEVSQETNPNFSHQPNVQLSSDTGNQIARQGTSQNVIPQLAHPMNPMGQTNMGQWNGQMDPASMAYWWNMNGGSGGSGSGNMPYWWNGGGSGGGGGGMPPPIL